MTSTISMTAIDYAALAERLEALAERLEAHAEPYDDEQRQWADDLRTVAAMLEGMADQLMHYYVYCLDDGDRTVLATSKSFTSSMEAIRYAASVAPSRDPHIGVWIDTAPLIASLQPTGKLRRCELLDDDPGNDRVYVCPDGGHSPLYVSRSWIRPAP